MPLVITAIARSTETSAKGRDFAAWFGLVPKLAGIGNGAPVMFYNGGTRDAKWRIGWTTFDAGLTTVTARCDGPLIAPDREMPADAGDMVFAVSAVHDGDDVLLYFSQADQDLRVARLRQIGPSGADR